MSDNIDRWNDRRIILEEKSLRGYLSWHEMQELDLLTRCVDYYIQQKMPGHSLASLKRLVQDLRRQGRMVDGANQI